MLRSLRGMLLIAVIAIFAAGVASRDQIPIQIPISRIWSADVVIVGELGQPVGTVMMLDVEFKMMQDDPLKKYDEGKINAFVHAINGKALATPVSFNLVRTYSAGAFKEMARDGNRVRVQGYEDIGCYGTPGGIERPRQDVGFGISTSLILNPIGPAPTPFSKGK